MKEEIRQPDIVMRATEFAFDWVKANLKFVIAGIAVFCIVVAGVLGYSFYERKQSEKVQATISQGVESLHAYNASGKKEDLDKAEDIFKKVVKERRAKIYMMAELYLGTVYAMKGQTEDAKKIYQELARKSPPVLKMLSEKALQNLNVK